MRIKDPSPLLKNVDAKADMADDRSDVRRNEPQRETDGFREVRHRQAKDEQKERKETRPQPVRPPRQTHQGVEANKKSYGRNLGLLHHEAQDLQGQRQKQQSCCRPPASFGYGQQLLPLPPEQDQDEEWNQYSKLIIHGVAVHVFQPAEE